MFGLRTRTQPSAMMRLRCPRRLSQRIVTRAFSLSSSQQKRQEKEYTSSRQRFSTGLLLAGAATVAMACSLDETTECRPDANSGSDRGFAKTNFSHAPRFPNLAIFGGPANPELAKEISENLGVDLGDMTVKKFADGEVSIRVNENVRGKDCFIIQPTCPPDINSHLVELLLMISTLRRASCGTITAVIPYYGYARQDRKMQSRVPISAADVARLLESMGVDRVVAVDLHCGQIQGFFSPNVPVDNLEGHVVGLNWFRNQGLDTQNLRVVSPDAGGVYRAKQFREGLRILGVQSQLAMIIKQRGVDNAIKTMDLVGDVAGCDCIMVDDMIDTAGTLTKAAKELEEMGAKRVWAFATHGIFSGPAYERIGNSVLQKVVVTNSIPLQPGAPDKIVQLSIGHLLSESIARIHLQKSVSAMFFHSKD